MTISDIVVNLLTIADNPDNVAQKESDGIRSIATKLESFLNNKAPIQEIISEYEKSQKNIQPVWLGEGWYKGTPNSFNYFASGFEAGMEYSKQQKENN